VNSQFPPKDDPLPWLLESRDPGVRYLALRDLVGMHSDSPELVAAQKAAYSHGPIAVILENMNPQGFWSRPGPGYTHRYFSTVWSLIMLAQLGGKAKMDTRIARACDYLLDASLTPQGQFSYNGSPSGTIDCLQGNLCTALVRMGIDDPRLSMAFEWMARTVTGEGIAPITEIDNPMRYYTAKCGPLFACHYNGEKSCAWGAAKVMLAFALWPAGRRTPLIELAIRQGADFLLSADPARADYPTRLSKKPDPRWWKFGFPVFYITDILQLVEVLVSLGYGADPRLANVLQLIREKQDSQGRWNLEYDYTGKTWFDFGPKAQPNKWVTLRALKALKGTDK
jgi:hypothetical protein